MVAELVFLSQFFATEMVQNIVNRCGAKWTFVLLHKELEENVRQGLGTG